MIPKQVRYYKEGTSSILLKIEESVPEIYRNKNKHNKTVIL